MNSTRCPMVLATAAWLLFTTVADAQQKAQFDGHELGVAAVAVNADASLAASGGYDRTLRVWNPADAGKHRVLGDGAAWVRCVAFAPDGFTLASGSDTGRVAIRDLRGDKIVVRFQAHEGPVTALAFSRDGKTLATSGLDKTVRLWNAADGKAGPVLNGHAAGVLCVSFSPDGRRVLSGGLDGTARIWNVQTGKAVVTFSEHREAVRAAAFSADGLQVASIAVELRLWDAATGKAKPLTIKPPVEQKSRLIPFRPRAKWFGLRAVAFAPDGRSLVTGDETGRLRRWRLDSGELLETIGSHDGAVSSLAFSADGKTLVTGGSDRTVRLWYFDAVREAASLPDFPKCVCGLAISGDGRTLATAEYSGLIRLWSTDEWKPIASLPGHGGSVYSLDFSHSGELLASADFKGTLILWDVPNRKPLKKIETGKFLTHVAVSPDERLVACGNSSTIVLRSATDGKQIAELQTPFKKVYRALFSPDGKRLAVRDGVHVVVWDVATRKIVLNWKAHEKSLRDLAYSPDGRILATIAGNDSIKLWDAATGKQLTILGKGENHSRCVAFSPDGNYLATADGKTIHLWSLRTGKAVAALTQHPESIWRAVFHPREPLLIVSGGNSYVPSDRPGFVKVWDVSQLLSPR